jgi:hypothetical protein
MLAFEVLENMSAIATRRWNEGSHDLPFDEGIQLVHVVLMNTSQEFRGT